MVGALKRLKELKSDFFKVPIVEVWLPDSYDPFIEHAVIYMLDGQWLFDASLTWANQAWEVDKSIAMLMYDKKIPPTIVVGIWHHEETRNTDYLPNKVFELLPTEFQDSLTENFKLKVQSDALLKFIVHELKPIIGERFSVSEKREHHVLMGSSKGALLSMYGVCEFPEVFSGAGCLSPHWCLVLDGGYNPAPNAFMDYLKRNLLESTTNKFYFDLGTGFYDNRNLPFQPAIDSIFKEKGYTAKNWISKIVDGHNHSEKYWALRFPDVISFLLTK